MRWIFYFLVILNLAAGIWFLQADKPSLSQARLADVGDLKIVSDIELQIRADAQKQKELQKKQIEQFEQQIDEEEELPRPEYDDFVFDEEDEALETEAICLRLGPFQEKEAAETVAADLADLRLAASIDEQKLNNIKGYWAMLPAPSSRDEAISLVAELKKKGIKDIWRFMEGDHVNAVSLGLFSREINAIKRARKLEKMGYVAMVKPRNVKTIRFWLEFEKPRLFRLPVLDIRMSYPDVRIIPCPPIAPD